MRILEPTQLYKAKAKKSHSYKKLFLLLSLLILLAPVVLSAWVYTLPLPVIHGQTLNVNYKPVNVSLPWPQYGQAAIGADGYGLLTQAGSTKPVPMASVAKIMTALAVLKKYPLKLGETGPTIPITQADEQIYANYLSQGGSVVEVSAGESITEYDALQAMLLPSANNIADTLATWSFSSLNSYLDYANSLALNMNLVGTHLSDASGFKPQTLSTARDMVLMGQKALANPLIAQIVSQASANISIIGQIKNTNYLLGQNGIIGIKTGNTPEAGGCYLFASTKTINSNKVTLIGAIMSAPTVGRAMTDSIPIINAAWNGFGMRKVVSAGQNVGYYDLPWGGKVQAISKISVKSFGWIGSPVAASSDLKDLSSTALARSNSGQLHVGNLVSDVQISSDVKPAGWRWRALRWL